MTRTAQRSPVLVDPGWLFLIAGLAVLAATVLIPATDDLAKVRWQRDRALAIEEHRLQRLARYDEYLAALDRGDRTLVEALVQTQLNKIPEGTAPIDNGPGVYVGPSDASVFPSLEPPAIVLPAERKPVDSLLERWTTDDHSRLWLIAAGAACVLLGLMPASRGWSGSAPRTDYTQQ